MNYEMKNEYEMIAKHCPRCEALVMAVVVKTVMGDFYKYRDVRCSSCNWSSAAGNEKNS